MAARNPDAVVAVRRAYVFDKWPLTQAAAAHGVPIGTARRWKKRAQSDGDDWDKARASASMSTGSMDEILSAMVNDFVTLHQTLTKEITENEDMLARDKIGALNSLADSFSKCIAAAGRASPRLNRLSFAMELVENLGAFVQERHPEHALAFAEILEPFGAEIAKQYG